MKLCGSGASPGGSPPAHTTQVHPGGRHSARSAQRPGGWPPYRKQHSFWSGLRPRSANTCRSCTFKIKHIHICSCGHVRSMNQASQVLAGCASSRKHRSIQCSMSLTTLHGGSHAQICSAASGSHNSLQQVGGICQHLGHSFAHLGSAGHLFARFSGVPHDQGHIHDLAERLHAHSRALVMVTQTLLPAPDTTLSSAHTGCNSRTAAHL